MSILKRIFSKRIRIESKPGEKLVGKPIEFKVTKPSKEEPLIRIKQRGDKRPKMELPEEDLSDAEALSAVVNAKPAPAPAQKSEKPVSVDEVAAALKRKPQRKQEAVMQRPKERKRATRKTKHDKLVQRIVKR